jgi:hypothetical protein
VRRRITDILIQKKAIYIIFFVGINALNIQSVIIHRLNVFNIFRQGFFHLAAHKDLYAFYPAEYFDSYLYSPSFGVLFAPFSLLPYYVSYFLWNNINMLIIPFLIFKMKGISPKQAAAICYIALIEMLTCLQGTQTNVMIAALMLIAFMAFEKRSNWLAAFALAAGFYIKVYPIIGVSLFLLYPNKINFLWKFIVAFLALGALPLLFISPTELAAQYNGWYKELTFDQGDNIGKISLTGLTQVYFHVSDFGKLCVQLGGVVVFCLMYLRTNLFKFYNYRLFFLAALLIWVVIFNHAAEIYGYAIAILGVGFWYTRQKQTQAMKFFIVSFVFIATVLSIDPTPRVIIDFIYDHALKSLPFCLIFFTILWQMLQKPHSYFYNEPYDGLRKDEIGNPL